MSRRYRKAKKALERIAIGAVLVGIGTAFYFSKPQKIDPYKITYKNGVYNNTEYIIWEQPGTWTDGFSLGDDSTFVSYERKENVLTNNGRFTISRNINYTGDAPHVRETQADSILRALKQHDSQYKLNNDYKQVLDEYTNKLE